MLRVVADCERKHLSSRQGGVTVSVKKTASLGTEFLTCGLKTRYAPAARKAPSLSDYQICMLRLKIWILFEDEGSGGDRLGPS